MGCCVCVPRRLRTIVQFYRLVTEYLARTRAPMPWADGPPRDRNASDGGIRLSPADPGRPGRQEGHLDRGRAARCRVDRRWGPKVRPRRAGGRAVTVQAPAAHRQAAVSSVHPRAIGRIQQGAREPGGVRANSLARLLDHSERLGQTARERWGAPIWAMTPPAASRRRVQFLNQTVPGATDTTLHRSGGASDHCCGGLVG